MAKRKTLKDFSQAADETVKDELRYGLWRVYDHYEIYELPRENDAYVKVPLVPGRIYKIEQEYNPLNTKGLFFEFARLIEKGDVTQETWLDWTQRYGVLGVDWMKGWELCRGGPKEKFSVFKGEAEIANWVLRLYEEATAEEPDIPAIRELLEARAQFERSGMEVHVLTAGTPEEIQGWALSEVARVVQKRLASECFPRLYRRPDFSFVQSPSGFGSLVGAMYLQMMWLMTATGTKKRCDGPGCDKIIYFDADYLPGDQEQRESGVRGIYRSRKFCSTNCRVKRWQHDKKKAQRHGD
jgi:hypothetical protein